MSFNLTNGLCILRTAEKKYFCSNQKLILWSSEINWHECWRFSCLLFRRSKGNKVSGPLVLIFFFSFLFLLHLYFSCNDSLNQETYLVKVNPIRSRVLDPGKYNLGALNLCLTLKFAAGIENYVQLAKINKHKFVQKVAKYIILLISFEVKQG